MPFPLSGHRRSTATMRLMAATLGLALLGILQSAFADPAYIPQINENGARLVGTGVSYPQIANPLVAYPIVPAVQNQSPTGLPSPPEINSPGRGNNFAQSAIFGNNNLVAQIQAGANDVSTVGILGGSKNAVGVLQAGNNLLSTVTLVNTQGLAVGVIQPPHSLPVQLLVARLPNGGLLIAH